MKPLMICHNTKKILNSKRVIRGRIHSVFKRVCNIITPEGILIPLISHQLSISPGGILVELLQNQEFSSMGFKRNLEVEVLDMILRIEGMVELDLTHASQWDGKPPAFEGVGRKDLKKNVEVLRHIVLNAASYEGVASIFPEVEGSILGRVFKEKLPINHYSSYILPRMLKLINAIKDGKEKEIIHTSKEIIGFGPGLTPSADDFVAGLMISMIYSAIYSNVDIKPLVSNFARMVEEWKLRTTIVSSEMLRHAAKGEGSEDVKVLMMGMFSLGATEDFEKAILRVINHGSTSGSDMASGLYVGCVLFFNIHNERVNLFE
ncbi:DUF2877 domain-containing protein [Alkaliphilus serpentinus]|uniref:DUF2877 domain-containing protein n=1 Tax=Alkaliphilus serpentinus TaxID=1482731 RepID=A0A833HQL0_9FIRM|nr:DUF2877 domain-containing protein [Alkaliphilus serpentinus]KAB3532090.1 DUF2877 domain-containing protein [Alkaliphilus serpentinus]